MYWSGGHWPAAALSLLFIDPISGASDCCQTRSRAICLSPFASLTPPLLPNCPLTTDGDVYKVLYAEFDSQI